MSWRWAACTGPGRAGAGPCGRQGCRRGRGRGPTPAASPPVLAHGCWTGVHPLKGLLDHACFCSCPAHLRPCRLTPSSCSGARRAPGPRGPVTGSVVQHVGPAPPCVPSLFAPGVAPLWPPSLSGARLPFPEGLLRVRLPGREPPSSHVCPTAAGLDLHAAGTLPSPSVLLCRSLCVARVWPWSRPHLRSEWKRGNQASPLPRSRSLAVIGKGGKEDSHPDLSSGSERAARRRRRRRGSEAERAGPQEQPGGPPGRGARKRRRRPRARARAKVTDCQELQTKQPPSQSRK